MIDAYEFINKVYKTKRDPVSRDYDRVVHYLKKIFDFNIHTYRTGNKYSGWPIPEAWELHHASLTDGKGKVVFDHTDHPLRVMRYSIPKTGFVRFDELRRHVRVDARLSDAIPYVTNPYPPYDWAFCMTLQEFAELDRSQTFYINIDSEFKAGEMKVLEWFHKGQTQEEIIFNAHLDGVGMADYGLSGVAMILHLIEYLNNAPPTHYSYRFIIGPQMIGSTAYLSENTEIVRNCVAAVDLDFMGNNQLLKIQKTPIEDDEVDCVGMELKRNNIVIDGILDFGAGNLNVGQHTANDTFVYNTFGIPMISMWRLPYRNAHTNLDDIGQINEISLEESLEKLIEFIEIYESNKLMLPVGPGPIYLDSEDFPENLIPEGFNFYKFCALYSHDTILNVAQNMKVLYCDLLEIVKMLERKNLIKTRWESGLMLH